MGIDRNEEGTTYRRRERLKADERQETHNISLLEAIWPLSEH